MNDLEKIFTDHQGNVIHKWKHYFDIYDRHFLKFRNKAPVILEIGVYKGGSLEMWEQYFGKGVRIYGVDINPNCKKFEKENITILIGSQEDPGFLTELKKLIGAADIIIDDGGHTMKQLKTSFTHLYDLVKEDGVYLAEDLHTAYWYNYGGGLGRKSNFIEYGKKLVDEMHQWYYDANNVGAFAKSIYGIHFYDSIIVFEKGKKEKPGDVYSGKIDNEEIINTAPSKNYWELFKYLLHKYTSINIS
jgi:hypothetical protein